MLKLFLFLELPFGNKQNKPCNAFGYSYQPQSINIQLSSQIGSSCGNYLNSKTWKFVKIAFFYSCN